MKQSTLQMIQLLPSWMKIRQDPENTQGGQFLDTIGQQTQELFYLLDAILVMRNPAVDPFYHQVQEDGSIIDVSRIQQVDLYNVDYVYRVQLPPALRQLSTFSVNGEGERLDRCTSVFDFYRQGSDLKYYHDADDGYIYLRQAFSFISINGAVFGELEAYHIWGPYDEVGLLLGCPRLPGEANQSYRDRLLGVYRSPSGSSQQGMLNHLSRSLGIGQSTIGLFEFTDAYVEELYHKDSIASELWEFLDLAAKVNGSVGSAYWDIIDNYNRGIRYLPIHWGASMNEWTAEEIQDGIGDGDDLLLTAPRQLVNEQAFEYQLGVEGISLEPDNKYPDINFKYKVYCEGKTYGDDGIAPENFGTTVLSAPLLPIKAKVTLEKDYLAGPFVSASTWTKPVTNTSAVYRATIPVNPMDTKKESTGAGEYTWLEVCIPITDRFRNQSSTVRDEGVSGPISFNNVSVQYVTPGGVQKQINFTNFDFGADDFLVIDKTSFIKTLVPIDRSVISGDVYIVKHDDNILYREAGVKAALPDPEINQTQATGAYLGQSDQMVAYNYREDWLACDQESSIGCAYLDNGSISIAIE